MNYRRRHSVPPDGEVGYAGLASPSVHVRKVVEELRRLAIRLPPSSSYSAFADLLEWLGLIFGFQEDNVRNQHDHIVLQLANIHMRQFSSISSSGCVLDQNVVLGFREKVLENYEEWCFYLGIRSNVDITDLRGDDDAIMCREILYVALYLLIWGESANLRFLPECLCFIFHHMAMELNRIISGCSDNDAQPAYSGENAFLNCVVKPIYESIRLEATKSKNGSEPYSKWRNYDDFNEYFWSKRCFKDLQWPLNLESEFFRGTGKTGFVEWRTFFSVFWSFHRLWLMLILFLQGAIILAWEDGCNYPWQALSNRDVKVRFLSVVVTWSGLEFLRSMLYSIAQYRLVERAALSLGARMLMSNFISGSWAIVLGCLYIRIWLKKTEDGNWFPEAERREREFLKVACPFILLKLLPCILSLFPGISKYWRLYGLINRSYIGRSLREGLLDYAKYSAFWLIILSAKFSFSYFLQIRPMIEPTKELWNHKSINGYEWHEAFTQRHHGVTIGLLWFPIVLIYLMDLQFWYAICTFLVGVLVGLISGLGVIRSIGQLRYRFHLFVREVGQKFNFMPNDIEPQDMENHRWFDMRNIVVPEIMKLKPDHVKVRKFALMWNDIIGSFRDEDIISDYEAELLMFPLNPWNVSVITWPCFLLRDNLLRALRETRNLTNAPDKWVCDKIFKENYTRCAVVEAYESIKHLLLDKIIDPWSEEHGIIQECFQVIDMYIQIGKFTKMFDMAKLPRIIVALIEFLESLTKAERDLDQVVKSLQTLYIIFVQNFFSVRKTMQELRQCGLAPENAGPNNVLFFRDVVKLPDPSDMTLSRQIRRLQIILTCRDSMDNIPSNEEARRRIIFFGNSLFMGFPKAPTVEKMKSFSVLTPYYQEHVLYSKEQLKTNNEDGINVLYYLQKVYDGNWENFIERMRREGMVDESEIWTTKLTDLKLWASYRGQTLARTVRGMMYYDRAIRLLSFLESQPVVGSSEGSGEPLAASNSIRDRHQDIASMKFMYLVACQNYGEQKAKDDPLAEDILHLMKAYEGLRVAYVDKEVVARDEYAYYSVLCRYDRSPQKEVEIYRIKLPGPFKLGEGKPENQNHAIIFTRGDAVQTIDMNQDNYLEEALKMGSLLEEFDAYHGIRKPTIIGVREHIFTASVSSLAWFMSTQETGFVTSGQRVLANPLKVRMHYGHPDVFDRIWFLTRGGVSKASRVINICEDIFAGFNCTLRGGSVTHHEYMQIGKGRDVGLNQISMFEAKIAGGSAEQLLSRDVYRLGHKLDFFRMLSFYHSSVGFYFNNIMVIWTMYALFWGKLYMAFSGSEDFLKGLDTKVLRAVLDIQFIQLVLFTGLPIIVDGSVENGILPAIWDFILSQLQLSSVFYTFSMGTRAHFFGRAILHGGAKYRGTGRGFVVKHESFASNYRLYARSHFIKAIELAMVLTTYSIFSPLADGTFAFIDVSISGWFLVFSWIFSPFIFNPSGFDWIKCVDDLEHFMDWIWYHGSVFALEEDSWERWWYQEQDHLRTTGFWGKSLEIILSLRFFFFHYGIVYRLNMTSGSSSFSTYLLSWIYVAMPFALYIVISFAHRKYAVKSHIYYRFIKLFAIVSSALVISALRHVTSMNFSHMFGVLVAALPVGWGLILIAQVLRPILQRTILWDTVVSVARMYDLMFGFIVMAPVAILAWLPGTQSMQTRILFNAAFSRGLQVCQMLASITRTCK